MKATYTDQTRVSPGRRVRRHALFASLIANLILSGLGNAQSLPFFPGEELTYRVRLGILGTVGEGTMRVEGPVDMRGTSTLVLRSEVRSTVAMIRGIDRSSSWIDPIEMRTLRFEKHERSPFASLDEEIDVFGSEHRWESASGSSGTSQSSAPLDELSFIYFIRTLPLEADATYSFDRHFDRSRNPISVRVLGRERIEVGAGEFSAIAVEMRVRDPKRYRGEGVIRVHLSDDACRLPLRIESAMPRMGTTVLTLEAHTHPKSHHQLTAR